MFWYALGWLIMKTLGWHTAGGIDKSIKKAVLIGAPHTSNWDFPIAMSALQLMGIKVRFLAKQELFKGFTGWIMRALGGIPVDRSRHTSMVEAMAHTLAEAEELIVLIPPEGTRSAVSEWKTGFYHVARLAGVPIIPAYLDYGKKEAGIMAPYHPVGDYETDIARIKGLYKGITPKFPEKWNG